MPRVSGEKANSVVLIIEGDRDLAGEMCRYLEAKSLSVLLANRGTEGLAQFEGNSVDIVVIADRLPDANGLDLCSAIQSSSNGTRIIFLSARTAFDAAVLAMRGGACDFLTKPIDLEALGFSVDRALQSAALERTAGLERYKRSKEEDESALLSLRGTFGSITGDVKRASEVNAPVLISGETGTGKTVAAQTIHYWGGNRQGAFININCAALPENLLEAELFGHEKGAFTGAVATRKGFFEMSQKGTLFLDELCELPIHLQAKLLSALEEKKIRRIGASGMISLDVRIIAATSYDPMDAVEAGVLRSDLYYRLCVMQISIPPLRERPMDIPPLCSYLLEQIAGEQKFKLDENELERLMRYSWPGNVRELRNVLERAVILQRGPLLSPSRFLSGQRLSNRATPIPRKVTSNLLDQEWREAGSKRLLTLKEIERKHIALVLEAHSGNQTVAARTLGIGISTLKRKIKAYGLARRRYDD